MKNSIINQTKKPREIVVESDEVETNKDDMIDEPVSYLLGYIREVEKNKKK